MNRETVQVCTRGHSWVTGDKAPVIEGWVCFFVSHYGTRCTVWTYRRVEVTV